MDGERCAALGGCHLGLWVCGHLRFPGSDQCPLPHVLPISLGGSWDGGGVLAAVAGHHPSHSRPRGSAGGAAVFQPVRADSGLRPYYGGEGLLYHGPVCGAGPSVLGCSSSPARGADPTMGMPSPWRAASGSPSICWPPSGLWPGAVQCCCPCCNLPGRPFFPR